MALESTEGVAGRSRPRAGLDGALGWGSVGISFVLHDDHDDDC